MRLIEAVSLSGLLGDVGTVAGIAAALISAVLAAIVLGQGRELKRLRDELEAESERARQAEASITSELVGLNQVARAAPVAQAPAVPPAVPLAAAAASATVAGDSTGEVAVGGASAINSSAMPALGSATAAPAIAALAEGPRLLHDPVPERPPAEVPAAVASPPRPSPIVIPAPVPAPAATPAGAAAGGNGPLGAPSTPAAGGISRSPKPPVEAPRRRSIVPRVIGGVVLLAAVIFGVIWFAGSGSDPVERTTATTSAAKPGQGVIVSVLNGTPVAGLAGEVSAELSRDGFKRGRVATARDQQQPKTVVAYMPGHLTDAEAVSQSLKLDAAPVPADDPTQAIACPDPATCNVEVIVTVGADRTR